MAGSLHRGRHVAGAGGPTSSAAGAPGTLNSEATPGSDWDVLTMSSLKSPGTFNLQVIGLGTGTGASAFNGNQAYQWVAGTVPAAALTGTGINTTFNIRAPQGFSGYTNVGAFTAAFAADPNITGQEDLVVSYTSAPEPGSLAVLGLGGGLLLLRRRRARRSKAAGAQFRL